MRPLRWAETINQFYQASRLSPAVGASLARTLELAGYRRVRADWSECGSDGRMVENMLMFYDEVGDRDVTNHRVAPSRRGRPRRREPKRRLPAPRLGREPGDRLFRAAGLA